MAPSRSRTGDRVGRVAVLAALGLAACARHPAPVTAAGGAGCTPPVPRDSADVRATVGGEQGGDCVAFVDEDVNPIRSHPTIWRRHRGSWTRLQAPFDEQQLRNHGWMAAAADGDTIVAALDSRIESTSWDLTIVRSGDGGVTWRAPVKVTKPYYLATLHELRLESDGRTTLVVVVADDYGAGVEPGLYRYELGGEETWVRAR